MLRPIAVCVKLYKKTRLTALFDQVWSYYKLHVYTHRCQVLPGWQYNKVQCMLPANVSCYCGGGLPSIEVLYVLVTVSDAGSMTRHLHI